MHAQYALFNKSCNGKVVKKVDKFFPELEIIPTFAFVEEPIYLGDILIFVVSSKKRYFVRVLDLIGHQETNTLYALFTSVNIVSQK